MKIIITGATGLVGTILLQYLESLKIDSDIICLVRATSNLEYIKNLDLNLRYFTGDSGTQKTWHDLISQETPDLIIHIASINHVQLILNSLSQVDKQPRIIVIGSTGVYSKFRQAAQLKQEMETQLEDYSGSYCLLRPTMIYGSPRDKNIHRLVKFCDRRGFFPIFGSGENLLQPIHAEDLAQALLSVYQNPQLQGAYDLSGGSIVSFKELINLISEYLGKPVRQISLPLNLGVWSATMLENLLQSKSPVRGEQILRLQENKAFPHDRAKQDFGFSPRTLEVGLKQEIELMRQQGLIS